MILQTSQEMPEAIREDGCGFMCVPWWVSVLTKRAWSPQSIKALYYRAKKVCVLGNEISEAYINNWLELFELAGMRVTNFRKEPAGYKCREDEYEILRWIWNNAEHFTAGNGEGVVTYDPWGISQSATKGTLKNKWVFRRA